MCLIKASCGKRLRIFDTLSCQSLARMRIVWKWRLKVGEFQRYDGMRLKDCMVCYFVDSVAGSDTAKRCHFLYD